MTVTYKKFEIPCCHYCGDRAEYGSKTRRGKYAYMCKKHFHEQGCEPASRLKKEEEERCLGCDRVHDLCCVCGDPMPCDDAGIDGDFVCDACVHYELVDEPPMSWSINGRNHCE